MRRLFCVMIALSVVGLAAIGGRAVRPLHALQQTPSVLALPTSDAHVPNPFTTSRVFSASSEKGVIRLSAEGGSARSNSLERKSSAILLRNQAFDTVTGRPDVPHALRVGVEPGAFMVQAKEGAFGTMRRDFLARNVEIVSYVPNNTLLVKARALQAAGWQKLEYVQAVIPLEPYYKLEPKLIREVEHIKSGVAAENLLVVDVLLLPRTTTAFLEKLSSTGMHVLKEGQSLPFGDVLQVSCHSGELAGLAAMQEVQAIQQMRSRKPAMDRARVFAGVAFPAVPGSNYQGLSGAGVKVALADSGLDVSHPDIAGRAAVVLSSMTNDVQGHGTHMAGIIAGTGFQSTGAGAVPGSTFPAAADQFRGVAPGSFVLGIPAGVETLGAFSDAEIQRTAALYDAPILNGGWVYPDAYDYDFAAASYDAAVRDALPGVFGPQSLITVFPAGNGGAGHPDGTGGFAGSVASPATAKNVITVGALEQARFITNEVVECTGDPPEEECVTNVPCLLHSDSASQVAAYSARGNVGIGVESVWGRFKPDVVVPGSFIVAARSSEWSAEPTNSYAQVLGDLNATLGQAYRIESGTSGSSATTAGTIALIQQLFSERLNAKLTPALAKALILNGAIADPLIGISVRSNLNVQGWGRLNLPAAIHISLTNASSGTNSMFFRQEPALSTDESFTQALTVQPSGYSQSLKATLVWTDPAANPLVGLKLVNDLDLVITNLDTGQVYLGNDFAPGAIWTSSWDGASEADFVNNVERILIPAGTGTNFSVAVHGRQVTTDVTGTKYASPSQDFALVISCGDGSTPRTIALSNPMEDPPLDDAKFFVLTNFTAFGSNEIGTFCWEQRVGGNSPGAGETGSGTAEPITYTGDRSQWRFYVATNTGAFSKAAFVVFGATNVVLDSQGASSPNLDLYVSTDSRLLELDPDVLQNSLRSTGTGDEWVLSDSGSEGPYFIGVKCESHLGVSFNLATFFREEPFWSPVSESRYVLNGVPSLSVIPGPTNTYPGAGIVFALPPHDASFMRRVVSSNLMTHADAGSVRISLERSGKRALLKNVCDEESVELEPYVFDDSLEGEFPLSRHSSDTNALGLFIGKMRGPFVYRYSSSSVEGTNYATSVFVDVETAQSSSILGGKSVDRYFEIPPGSTNCNVTIELLAGQGPLLADITPAWMSTSGFNQTRVNPGITSQIAINAASDPPLEPGYWRARLRNEGLDDAQVAVAISNDSGLERDFYSRTRMGDGGPIADSAISRFSMTVSNRGIIRDIQAGLHLMHPRLGDLRIALISPAGTRVMLTSNRGGISTNGMGAGVTITNLFPVISSGGALVASNKFDLKKTSGDIFLHYDFWAKPDWMRMYYEGVLIFDSGLVSDKGTNNIAYGPGTETSIVVVMNEGDNSDPDTSWFYEITSVYQDDGFLVFSDNANVPIRFSAPPYDQVDGARPRQYVLAEEPLSAFYGEQAQGIWTLEIADTFTGPIGFNAELVEAELGFMFSPEYPEPVGLLAGQSASLQFAPLQTRWISVDLNPWTMVASNRVVSATAPVNLLFTTNVPPGIATVETLLNNVTSGVALLDKTSPPVLPGDRYYLGVQNTNADFVSAVLDVRLSPTVTTLTNQLPLSDSVAGENSRHYTFFVGNPWRTQFRVWSLSGDVSLHVSKGLPLPSSGTAQIHSDNAGLQDELIVLRSEGGPVELTSGSWFVTVENQGTTSATYTIEAKSWYEPSEPFIITGSVVEAGQLCLTWRSLPGAVYHIESCQDLANPQWQPVSAGIVAESELTSGCIAIEQDAMFLRIRE